MLTGLSIFHDNAGAPGALSRMDVIIVNTVACQCHNDR